MSLNCLHCEAEYTPKQRFCSANCRVKHARSVTKALHNHVNGNDTVTKEPKPVTVSYQIVTVGPLEEENPDGKCPKHKGLLSLCHC